MPRPAESTLDLDTPSNPEVTDSGVVEPVRLVTSDFTYTSTTSAGPTKIGALGDVVAHNVGVLADHELVAEPIVLQGGSGMDLLVGGPGHDQLFGNQGDDTLVGQGGNDMLDGGEDADWLLGGAGDDHLIGGFGNDTLEGGAGNDRLEGGHDDDILKGGEGDDVLVGGSGRDVMIGGAGRDTFVAQPGFHYGGLDTVTDFQTGDGQPHWAVRDRIDLSAALDGSTFAGTTAAEAFAQGYIYFVQHGNPGEEGFGTTVRLDRNGSAENYGYHNDVALIDLQGVAADELRLSSGYYGPGNFIV